MNEIQNIKELLSEVSRISKEYDEKAKNEGENYNVFNILGLSTREVRTHSAFIADLLNPEGLHGKESTFLGLFIEQLYDNQDKTIKQRIKEKLNSFDNKKAQVIVEESIGQKEGDEGGRIDIVIKSGDTQIVIENKIYATDQDKQLVRYNNHYKNALLLYLTLEEKIASDESITKEDGTKLKKDIDYFNITYHTFIKNWLEECLKKTECKPFFTETLKQYINLVKQLTGQTMNDKMNDEIIKELNNDNIESAILLKNILENEYPKHLANEIKKEFDKVTHFKEPAINIDRGRWYIAFGDFAYSNYSISITIFCTLENYDFHLWKSNGADIDIKDNFLMEIDNKNIFNLFNDFNYFGGNKNDINKIYDRKEKDRLTSLLKDFFNVIQNK